MVGKHVFYIHKETKKLQNFSDIDFIITKDAKLKYP